MAGEEKPLKGIKKSVWFSGEELFDMASRGLEPAEVKRRGLASRDPVTGVEGELSLAVHMVARLATALANGGKVVYPGDSWVPREIAVEAMAAIDALGPGAPLALTKLWGYLSSGTEDPSGTSGPHLGV